MRLLQVFVSIVTILFGVYIGTSVSAYVANMIHQKPIAVTTKPAAVKPKTAVVTTPVTPAPVAKTTKTATQTPAVTPKVTTSSAVSTSAPTPAAVVVPAPSSAVTSLAPAPTTTQPATTTTTSTNTNTQTVTSYTSTNWSGYMATTGTFTSISGSWTVTQPTGNGTTTTSDATWIGIGGVSTSDLIQVGTDNTVTASGQVITSAFYELLPANARQIATMVVQPGDAMHASLSDVNGQWTITISDLTNAQSYTTIVAYISAFSSAEWIEEDPFYSNGTQIPFDNFGSVPFTRGSTTYNGASANILSAGSLKITMVDKSGTPIAVPSSIGSDGASFSVIAH